MDTQAVAGGGPEVAARPVSEDVAAAQGLVQEIESRREAKFKANIKAKPRASIWASQFSDCERQMTYEFTNWQDKKLHTWELETLFEAGRESELSFKAQLSDLGRRSMPQFELVESGAAMEANSPARELAEKFGIHGYLDTKIKWAGRRFPVEIKMMNEWAFDSIRHGVDGIEDMKRSLFYRKYVRQGLIYLKATDEKVLLFALTNGRGKWKFVILERDEEEIERLLAIASRVKANVASGTLPDRIPYSTGICGKCAFAHICVPDIKSVPSKKIEGNERVAELLERRDQIVEKWREVEKINDEIKETFENVGEGVYTVGNFIITRKGSQVTRYEVPDEIKAKYAVKKPQFKNKVERFAAPDPQSIYIEPRRSISFEEDA